MAGAYGTGEVTDSVDPEGKGRVRVSPGSGGAEAWLPVLKRHAGEGSGLWALPEAGAQAAYILTDAERGEGCVLGYVSDGAHLPPEGSGKSAADSKVLQTRRHRIEIIEEEGKEEIRLESADGRMRAAIGKEGGISLVNELGGIRIKCRKLTMESGENLGLESAKGTELKPAARNWESSKQLLFCANIYWQNFQNKFGIRPKILAGVFSACGKTPLANHVARRPELLCTPTLLCYTDVCCDFRFHLRAEGAWKDEAADSPDCAGCFS